MAIRNYIFNNSKKLWIVFATVLSLLGSVGCSARKELHTLSLKPGMPNTVTYVENGKKKTVWDLRGCWNASEDTIDFGRIDIKQQKNYFEAINTKPKTENIERTLEGAFYAKRGEIAFDGYIDGNQIKNGWINTYRGPFSFNGNISLDGNAFDFAVSMPGGTRYFEHIKFKRCTPTRSETR